MSLSGTIAECLRLTAKMRQDGATPDEIHAYIEAVLRESWPKGRVWKYICDRCQDTGWEYFQCAGSQVVGPSDCARTKAHLPHNYVEYCTCEKGNRMAGARAMAAPDALESVAKKPAKSFSKWGRP